LRPAGDSNGLNHAFPVTDKGFLVPFFNKELLAFVSKTPPTP
jgi:hypothetical protein